MSLKMPVAHVNVRLQALGKSKLKLKNFVGRLKWFDCTSVQLRPVLVDTLLPSHRRYLWMSPKQLRTFFTIGAKAQKNDSS